MLSMVGGEVFNTVHIGFGFLLLYSADFTINNLLPILMYQINLDNPDFKVNGFFVLGGLYLVYALALWLAPSINTVIGPRIGMIIGSLCITSHIFIIEFEVSWLIYLGTLCSGFGGSILWVGEGNYMVLNSKPNNFTRNIGIFWALYTISMILGNLYMTVQLEGVPDFNRYTRTMLIRILTGVGIASTIVFSFLNKPSGAGAGKIITEGPINAFKKTISLYMTKDFFLLIFTFIYAGFQQSFGWGIYSTCIGYTQSFGAKAAQLVPLSSLIYGIGDSLGGAVHVFFKKQIFKQQRSIVILSSAIIQLAAFIMTFLNLPNDSVFGPTSNTSVIVPNIGLSLVCSFLLGVGDSCLNTQIFSIMAYLHPDHSAHTSALYKFTKCMAMAGFFWGCNSLGLHLQLCLLVILCLTSAGAFCWVDFKTYAKTKSYPVCLDSL